MKHAILAAEDERFYQHGGVDYLSVARAALANLASGTQQGAGTITMQVARNFFLTREKTVTRKLREVLLAWKIEANLSKDEILELYVNQIFLGQRAYGFAAASQIYFGKPLEGRHRRRGGDARGSSKGAVDLQPGDQSAPGQDTPAVRTATNARAALHIRRPPQGSTKRAIGRAAGHPRRASYARRVRRRDGPAGGLRRVRRRGLHPRHHGLDYGAQGRPGGGICRCPSRSARLRPPPRLPRARGLRQPACRSGRAGPGARQGLPGDARQRQPRRRRRAGCNAHRGQGRRGERRHAGPQGRCAQVRRAQPDGQDAGRPAHPPGRRHPVVEGRQEAPGRSRRCRRPRRRSSRSRRSTARSSRSSAASSTSATSSTT